MAWSERKFGWERMGGGSRLRGENPLHPERHPRHGGRSSSFRSCRNGNLVPCPKVVGGRILAERGVQVAGECEEVCGRKSGKAVYTRAEAFQPYLVRVSISDLNIRKGPGTDYGKTWQYTGKGVFTITEVKSGKGSHSGWGRLKSGAGWISLDYVSKV